MPPKKNKDIPIDSISSLLEKYKGREGIDIGSSDIFSYDRIHFQIPPLDKLIGGGIPRKRITLMIGNSNAGKSYLASQAVVSTQKEGGLCAWVDTEISWDPQWMKKCGVDTDNIIVAQVTTGEEALALIREFMKDGVDLVVLDSIAGLVPENVQDEDFSYNPMAWQARFINQSLPRLISPLRYGSALIMINQVRSSIGPVSLPNMPGGMAQEFFSHVILQVRRHGWIEENSKKVGFDIEIRSRKTKAGGDQYDSCIVPFRLEGGIDLVETWMREGIAQGFIKKSQAWYKIEGEEKSISGMNGLKQWCLDNPDKFELLKTNIERNEEFSEEVPTEESSYK